MSDLQDDDEFVSPSRMINEIANRGVGPLDADAFLNAGVTGNAVRCKSKATGEVYWWKDRQGVGRFGNGVFNSDFDLFAADFGAVHVSRGFSGPNPWKAFLADPDSLIDREAAWAFLEREWWVTRPQAKIGGKAMTAAFDSPPASDELAPRRRGPKPKYEWGAFRAALMERIYDNDGLSETQAEDERWAAAWFGNNYGKAPSESEIREHVKEVRDGYLRFQRVKRRENKAGN